MGELVFVIICSVEEVKLKARRDANKAYAERMSTIIKRRRVVFLSVLKV